MKQTRFVSKASLRGLVTAVAVTALGGAACAQAAAPAAPPPVSDIVRKQAERSKQDVNLRGHPVPPIATPRDKLPMDRIKVPEGFKVEVFATGLAGARMMLLSPKGTLFVSTRTLGRVYAVADPFGKKEVKTIAQGLTQPNGLAMKDGALFVAANKQVLRFDDIDATLDAPKSVDLSEKFNLPGDLSHGWRYTEFGPDGKLYIPVGANCNICEINPGTHAHIRRYDADGSNMEIVARGVRNTVGFDWHPVTKELWFTDNGRDWAGNEGPEDELNRLPKDKVGANFGFPYCHANKVADPDVVRPDPCAGVILPKALMGPHAAALSIKWYTGDMFPAKYKNVAFIARHGSWNREKKIGYDVVMATEKNGKMKVEPFLTGLLDEKTNSFHGRPVHILQLKDGSLLVSDENNGAIYRITYDGKARTARL
jgi:glucose/arabinose dehydrogenase